MRLVFSKLLSFLIMLVFCVALSGTAWVFAEFDSDVIEYKVPLISNRCDNTDITFYEINDKFYLTANDFYNLTNLGFNLSNNYEYTYPFDSSHGTLDDFINENDYNYLFIVDGIRTVIIDLKKNLLIENNSKSEIVIERYNDKLLFEAIPLLEYLVGENSCYVLDDRLSNKAFVCYAPEYSIWSVIKEANETIKDSFVNYNSLFSYTLGDRLFRDVAEQTLWTLKIKSDFTRYSDCFYDVLDNSPNQSDCFKESYEKDISAETDFIKRLTDNNEMPPDFNKIKNTIEEKEIGNTGVTADDVFGSIDGGKDLYEFLLERRINLNINETLTPFGITYSHLENDKELDKMACDYFKNIKLGKGIEKGIDITDKLLGNLVLPAYNYFSVKDKLNKYDDDCVSLLDNSLNDYIISNLDMDSIKEDLVWDKRENEVRNRRPEDDTDDLVVDYPNGWVDSLLHVKYVISENDNKSKEAFSNAVTSFMQDKAVDILSGAVGLSTVVASYKAASTLLQMIDKDYFDRLDRNILSGNESVILNDYYNMCNKVYDNLLSDNVASQEEFYKNSLNLINAYKFYYRMNYVYWDNVNNGEYSRDIGDLLHNKNDVMNENRDIYNYFIVKEPLASIVSEKIKPAGNAKNALTFELNEENLVSVINIIKELSSNRRNIASMMSYKISECCFIKNYGFSDLKDTLLNQDLLYDISFDDKEFVTQLYKDYLTDAILTTTPYSTLETVNKVNDSVDYSAVNGIIGVNMVDYKNKVYMLTTELKTVDSVPYLVFNVYGTMNGLIKLFDSFECKLSNSMDYFRVGILNNKICVSLNYNENFDENIVVHDRKLINFGKHISDNLEESDIYSSYGFDCIFNWYTYFDIIQNMLLLDSNDGNIYYNNLYDKDKLSEQIEQVNDYLDSVNFVNYMLEYNDSSADFDFVDDELICEFTLNDSLVSNINDIDANPSVNSADLNNNIDNIYYSFMKNTLIPSYGLSSLATVKAEYSTSTTPHYENISGILSANIIDIDNSEYLLVTIINTLDNIPHLQFELYGYDNGVVLVDSLDQTLLKFVTNFDVGLCDDKLIISYDFIYVYTSSRFGSSYLIFDLSSKSFSKVFTLDTNHGSFGWASIHNAVNNSDYFVTNDGDDTGFSDSVSLIKSDLDEFITDYTITPNSWDLLVEIDFNYTQHICSAELDKKTNDYTNLRDKIKDMPDSYNNLDLTIHPAQVIEETKSSVQTTTQINTNNKTTTTIAKPINSNESFDKFNDNESYNGSVVKNGIRTYYSLHRKYKDSYGDNSIPDTEIKEILECKIYLSPEDSKEIVSNDTLTNIIEIDNYTISDGVCTYNNAKCFAVRKTSNGSKYNLILSDLSGTIKHEHDNSFRWNNVSESDNNFNFDTPLLRNVHQS